MRENVRKEKGGKRREKEKLKGRGTGKERGKNKRIKEKGKKRFISTAFFFF